MAEEAFRKIIQNENTAQLFNIDSAGTQGYHQGELPDSRMRYHAGLRSYSFTHRSRLFTRRDFERFDFIIGMDDQNIADLKKQAITIEEDAKIYRMVNFCVNIEATHVPDPYYGGNEGFENVIDLLEDACQGLYNKLMNKEL